MPSIEHFDIPAVDIKRAKKFYSELFGWKIERMPGPMEYYGISTTDEEGKASIGGGMGKKQGEDQGIINYFGVSSIDEYIIKVEQLGGKIIIQKTVIPGYGYLALCIDTENNKFGLWQTDESVR